MLFVLFDVTAGKAAGEKVAPPGPCPFDAREHRRWSGSATGARRAAAVVALDLLAVFVISLLALLCYLRNQSYYLDAPVALALLSFVATTAAARYLGSGGPFG